MTVKLTEYFQDAKQQFLVVAGPCSIESREQLLDTAKVVADSGATLLRGGIYKLRTSPDSFQGLGEDAYLLVKEAKEKLGLPFIAEITDPRQIPLFQDYVDVIQVGSRNMYNYALLKELSELDLPVVLKRGFSATLDEWIKAADYLRSGGNDKVILCERGIRGFDNKTRNVLDLASVSYLKKYSDHIVMVDPSHATGDSNLVADMAKAAIFAGADGIMVEIHPNPEQALSDGPQALTFQAYEKLMQEIKTLLPYVQKELVRS